MAFKKIFDLECNKINQIQISLKDGIEIILVFKSMPG